MTRRTKKTTGIDERAVFWDRPFAVKWILFVVSVLLYANTLSHDYTQDDAIVIYENMYTTAGLEGIPGILQHDTFYGFFKEEGKDKLVTGGRYRPLTQVMFAVEWELFGRNPFIGHLGNVLLYALLVVLLYQTLMRLFVRYPTGTRHYLFVFMVALFFAVHPVHTEVVANIKGRDEIMSLLLSLATLWLILRWQDREKWTYLVASAPVFLAALLAKENAITFVVIIPLALVLFRKTTWKKSIGLLMVLFGMSFVFLLIRASVLGWDFGGKSMELMNNPFLKWEGTQYVPFTFGEKMATIFYTLGKYVQLLVFPHPLTHDYYPRQIAMMHWGDWRVILSFLTYLSLLVYAFLGVRKHRIPVFGVLFYLATLSIVSNIVFPIGTNMSERFLFMPSLGFAIVAGWLISRGYGKRPRTTLVLGVLVFLLFGLKTITRNTVWKNDFTLFTTDVRTSANSAKVLNAAGGALVTRASDEKEPGIRSRMLAEAARYLNRAIEIHPTYKNAYLILGNARFYQGDYMEAIRVYDRVLAFAPGFEEAEKNLAIAHREAGKDYGMNRNDLEQAIYHLSIARKTMPDDYETQRLFGIAHALSGRMDKAVEAFQAAVAIQPDNAGAYLNLGNAYYNLGDQINGELNHRKALELDPDIFDKNNKQN
jgi:tetratricopeptide (TPR) repeat protein